MSGAVNARLAIRTAGVVLAGTTTTAIIVAAGFAHDAREWLGFGFTGVPHTVPEALAIFLNNSRLVAGVAVATVAAQLRERGRIGGHRAWADPPVALAQGLCEAILVLAALVNIAIVGAALGAYGWRMAKASLPHGPFELAAYCVAASFYLDARGRSLPPAASIPPAILTAALLLVAAMLETFAAP